MGKTGLGLVAGSGLPVGTGIAGDMADASWTLDLRSRISIRRLSRISPGMPEIANVSSVFTSCAPDSGISL